MGKYSHPTGSYFACGVIFGLGWDMIGYQNPDLGPWMMALGIIMFIAANVSSGNPIWILRMAGRFFAGPLFITFGEPIDHALDNQFLAWHHIRVVPTREIPRCTIHVYREGIDPDSMGLRLHWQSPGRYHKDGVLELTLQPTQEYRIPLLRRETPRQHTNFNGSGWITDTRFMKGRGIDESCIIESDSSVNFKIVLRYKGKTHSREFTITIPPADVGKEGVTVSEVRFVLTHFSL